MAEIHRAPGSAAPVRRTGTTEATAPAQSAPVSRRVEPVDMRTELAKMRAAYDEGAANKTFNALCIGHFGTGKSRLATTCPAPVHMYSFDPGGSKTVAIQRAIKTGHIIVDSRFEKESMKTPTAFALFEADYRHRKASGYFDNIGTLFLDSCTSWGDALMNQITQKAGRPGGTPQLQDYMVQQMTMTDYIKDMMLLPCNVIMTGHIGTDKDEVTGKMIASLFISGKLTVKIPLLFDEIYFLEARERSNGVEYSLLTQNDGLYKARTRIGGEGIFALREPPDIKALLKKADYPYEDKPLYL